MLNIKQRNIRVLLIALLSCIFFVATLSIYSRLLNMNLHNENIQHIKEISDQNKVSINKKIDDIFNVIDETKYNILDHSYHNNALNVEEAIDDIKQIAKRQNFARIGLVLEDGTCYTTENEILDISNDNIFINAKKGEYVVSDPFLDNHFNQNAVNMSCPVFEDNKFIGAIFVTYFVNDFRDEITVNSFEGEGYSYVIKQNGDAVINSSHPTSFNNFVNLFKSLEDASDKNEKCSKELKEGLDNKNSGYIIFENKINKYCYYDSLGVNDWFLLTVVPESVIVSTTDLVMRTTTIYFITLSVIFFIGVYVLYRFLKNKNNDLLKVLYEDRVTHKISYQKFIKELPILFDKLKEKEKTAILIIDIDQFKLINDIFGYEQGDETIRYIADMIEYNLNYRELFARVTAEQFIVALIYKDKDELIERIKILRKFIGNKVVQTDRENLSLRSVVGIYEVNNIRADIQYMQNCAMIAHTQAKKSNDVDYLFYTDDMRTYIVENKKLEDKMKKGIQNNEFIVYYQPKYDTLTKKPKGAEALIRWKEEDGTIRTPGYFINLAEISGMIKEIDKIVFKSVCKDIRELIDSGKKVLPVSVNISKKTLYDSTFVEKYKSYIERYQIPVDYIQIEITESLLIHDQGKMKRTIEQLKEIGIKILMDDFGTGYSSLLMLKDMPIDILKLDKSFVDDYSDDKGSEILKATVELAQRINIDIVAEGVETQTQYEFIKELKCNTIQGYYFSKPIDRESYMKLIQEEISE